MTTKKGKANTSQKRGKAKARSVGLEVNPKEKSRLREALVELVLNAGKEIVQNVIEAAKSGNYLPAKYLFEFAGIADPLPETDEAAMAKVKSLTEILLETMHEQTSGE